ncbi:MAG: hypothetical protein WB392_12645 [Methanotrichaceae archaeon]
MAGKIILESKLPVSQTAEALAQWLIARYPTDFLSEIEVGWPYGIAIGVPEGGNLDTPRVIIKGSYQEIRAFEIVYQRAKDARILFSFPVSAMAMAEAI